MPSKLQRIKELEVISEDPNLWDNKDEAQKILKEKTKLELIVTKFDSLTNGLQDNIDLLELAEEENDEQEIKSAEINIIALNNTGKQLETESLFDEEADSNDCFIEIHSGAGGTESCDWAEMLLRMYLRWADKRNFSYEVIDENPGEEAGIKSVTFKIKGEYAFGWTKYESGVHRLVRISPFDSANRRHTSFASVWVYPVIDETINIEIEDKDIRIDTYRASGAGGQHVNKTDSAVRLTHLPTGIVSQCQNGRSQHKNKAEAMSMLKARLYELELRKRQEENEQANAEKTDNSWGNQIRSYVLHPYQMIKDLRTNAETGNTSAFLDGDLDNFMSTSLTFFKSKTSEQ